MTPLLDVNAQHSVPEWVEVWRWARARGESRVFPQQDEWALSESRLTQAEYNVLRLEWQAERSPGRASTAPESEEK